MGRRWADPRLYVECRRVARCLARVGRTRLPEAVLPEPPLQVLACAKEATGVGGPPPGSGYRKGAVVAARGLGFACGRSISCGSRSAERLHDLDHCRTQKDQEYSKNAVTGTFGRWTEPQVRSRSGAVWGKCRRSTEREFSPGSSSRALRRVVSVSSAFLWPASGGP